MYYLFCNLVSRISLQCNCSGLFSILNTWHQIYPENQSSHPEVFCKKGVLRNFAKFTGKHLCQSLFFKNFFKKETLAQVFSCEFCKISKNTFSYRTLLVAASDFDGQLPNILVTCLCLCVRVGRVVAVA